MVEVSEEHPRKKFKVDNAGEPAQKPAPPLSILSATEDQSRQENRFGVLNFVSQDPGFLCVLKQRYTDFLVNEVDRVGHVVHLEKPTKKPTHSENGSSAQLPTKQENNGTQGQKPSEQPAIDQKAVPEAIESHPSSLNDEGGSGSLSDEDGAILRDIFGEPTTSFLSILYGRILKTPHKKAKDLPQQLSEPIEDKQKRTDAHIAVRRIFHSRIETATGSDNRILIKASSSTTRGNNRQANNNSNGPRTKGKAGWDELGGEYLHFTLYKENKDTMEVLYFIASQLKVQVKNFQFAGTKDRRGVTVQRVSAYRVTRERLEALNPRLRQARLDGFEYRPQGLALGDLEGNEFGIGLRDCRLFHKDSVDGLENLLASKITSLKDKGFLNYYGLQRFGTHNVSTDEIGRRMLQGDLRGAVDGLLTFPAHLLSEASSTDTKAAAEDIARAQAIDAWNGTRKISAIIEKLPRRFQAENAVIRHLGVTDKRSGRQQQLEDFQGALASVPRNLRLMYVHAYQSLIWNMAASKRFELFGSSVVEGDLIITSQVDSQGNGKSEEVDENGEIVIHPEGADSATTAEERFERARSLSKDEAESGKISIFDIVLPQPGFDVVYPANAIGAYYKEIMAKDNLDPHDMRRRWKDISLSGGYRKVMARPERVSYELRKYSSDEDQLFVTDLDLIEGMTELPPVGGDEAEQKTALILRMQLGSSQYATMALRELTKGGAVAFKPDYSGR